MEQDNTLLNNCLIKSTPKLKMKSSLKFTKKKPA